MTVYSVDFTDRLNATIMGKLGIAEVYSNERKHLGEVDLLQLIFE